MLQLGPLSVRMIVDAKPMREEEVAEDCQRAGVPGKRRSQAEDVAPPLSEPTNTLDQDQQEDNCDVQGIDAAESLDDEVFQLRGSVESLAVCMREDETAEDEEEVDKQERMTDERIVVEMSERARR